MNAESGAAAGAVPPLRIPVFRAMWIASLTSNFGALIQSVGAAWMMTSLTRSPAMVALVQSSTTFPIMLLSLGAGAVADNLDRRKVMLCCQAYMLAISLTLCTCAWLGLLTPWLLLALTFLLGCGIALNSPSWAASVGDMVPRASLPGAVALNSMGFNIARSLGPAIGGLIVAAAGAAAAFTVNAFTYVGLILVLAKWRPYDASRSLPRETLGVAIAAGIRYVAMSPRLRVVMIRASFFGLFASAASALMPLIARDLIHGGARTYGLLLGAFGGGAVLGALLMARLRGRIAIETSIRCAIVALASGTVAAGLSRSAALTTIALFVAGTGWVLALSTFNVTVQLAAPRWVVGRALSFYQMSAFGAMAVGSWLVGELAAAQGVATTLMIVALCQISGLALGLLMPLPEVGEVNLDPLTIWSEPETDVSVEPRSGPVVIAIAYRIAPEDVRSFLAVMIERRRIRRRDGARNWTLLRDLGDRLIWIERYQVASWVDYVRHNRRRTHADAANHERLQQLHIGPDQPHIQRMIERQATSLPEEIDCRGDFAEPLTDPNRSN